MGMKQCAMWILPSSQEPMTSMAAMTAIGRLAILRPFTSPLVFSVAFSGALSFCHVTTQSRPGTNELLDSRNRFYRIVAGVFRLLP